MTHQTPQVAILMGSESDMSVMKKAGEILDEFGVVYDIRVMSAHRLPAHVAEFASSAKKNGIKVLIGGAGMAAHLAGALAAHSTLPVIGVPLTSQVELSGIDALLATVQMPKGVPVATVAVDGAANAGFLAVQILSLSDEKLAQKYQAYRDAQTKKLLKG